MTLYIEHAPGAFRAWSDEPIDGVSHPRDIEQIWTSEGLAAIGLYAPAPASEVPAGKQVVSTSVQRVAGMVRFVHELVDAPLLVRRMVRKSTVQARLIDAGLMEAAYALLTSNPVHFARWFAPDQPNVYADDPDALAVLATIGADAATVMAEEV